MKVLVTGGTGFIGTRIVQALREQERDVRVLVRTPERAARVTAWAPELATGDVTDAESLKAALDGCTHVIHLVSIIKGSSADFERVMIHGTENLIEAAQAAGVERFVLMSSLGTSATSNAVPYYSAKWAMEQAVAASGLRAHDLPAELRLRTRRRAAHVHGAGAALAGRDRDRLGPPAPAADLGRRRRGVLHPLARAARGGQPDVRDRRTRHRRLERALPGDRTGPRQEAASRPRPARRGTRGGARDAVAAGRAR